MEFTIKVLALLLLLNLLYIYVGGTIFYFIETRSGVDSQRLTIMECFYFCFTVLSTMGYGDIYLITPEGRSVFVPYAITGIPVFMLLVAGLGYKVNEICEKLISKCVSSFNIIKTAKIIILSVFGGIIFILVPAAVLIRIQDPIQYLTYGDAAYFMVVSLTTVGFGDIYMVSDSSEEVNSSQVYVWLMCHWMWLGFIWVAATIWAIFSGKPPQHITAA